MRKLKYVACSNCFQDEGLRIMAERGGIQSDTLCNHCGNKGGKKLSREIIQDLTFDYFYYGSTFRTKFGAANAIGFNEYHYLQDDITVPVWLKRDMELIGKILKVGFFYYGPRLWRLGHIAPLEKLQKSKGRPVVIREILKKYPITEIAAGTGFYRLRKNPSDSVSTTQYDSPPDEYCGSGRLDSKGFPVLYCSTNLDICIHECRVTLEDELFVAKLSCKIPLRLLNLATEIKETGDEFESLGIAISMLFNAPTHSYEIIRAIAKAVFQKGLDGIVYPSYFSAIHSNETPVNIALFGRPIAENKIAVDCVNRLMLKKVKYEYSFGPGAF